MSRATFICGLFASLSGCTRESVDLVRVFAAASAGETVEHVLERSGFEQGRGVQVHSAATSTLARQIELGAPAHLFLSADTEWMNFLARQALVEKSSRIDLLSNELVMIARPREHPALGSDGLPMAPDCLGLADPDHVPAGRYGKAALEHLDAWARLAPTILRTADVRGAAALVDSGQCEVAVVYATDFAEGVDVVYRFESAAHPPIRYPFALLGVAPSAEARQVYEALTSPRAREAFLRAGFGWEAPD